MSPNQRAVKLAIAFLPFISRVSQCDNCSDPITPFIDEPSVIQIIPNFVLVDWSMATLPDSRCILNFYVKYWEKDREKRHVKQTNLLDRKFYRVEIPVRQGVEYELVVLAILTDQSTATSEVLTFTAEGQSASCAEKFCLQPLLLVVFSSIFFQFLNRICIP